MTATLPFVGRDREVALLRAALDAALARQGTVALIGGEAGIGKTTLAEQILNEAYERGALVLTGRCYDLTETAPFAPWSELFSSYPTGGSLPEIPDSVARLELGGDAATQAALFAGVHEFLAALAGIQPVVILLDDQHWADDASLDLLRFLARQAAILSLFILVTYRSTELDPAHHLGQLVPLLAREARALRLNLHPLSNDDLWAIVRPRYQLVADDEARLTAYLQSRTEGNPFFAGELLQTLEEQNVLRPEGSGWALGDLGQVRTPILVEHIVGGRLAQLSESDQQLLAVAAVLGQELPLALWSEVAETDQTALLELLDRNRRARLIRETADGRGARFTHALIRQVIYERLAPSRRRFWHRRAGTTLAAAPAPDPDTVANHFRRSGDPKAAEWLIRAGNRAEQVYSWQAAAERFEAAVEALGESEDDAKQHGWLLVLIARMRRYAAPQVGLERLAEAGRIAEATGDRPLAGIVLWQSGLLRCLEGSIQHGIEQLEQGVAALAALLPAEREKLRAFEPAAGSLPDVHHDQGTLAMWLAGVGRYREAIKYATPYISEAANQNKTVSDYDAAACGDAYVAVARAHAEFGNPDESREAYARARAAYGDDRHAVHYARTKMGELQMRVLPYETDNLAERRRLEIEAESAWKRGSGALADDFAGAMRLPLQYVEGRWAEMISTALALRAHGTSSMRAEAAYWLGPVARAQGDAELAWELVDEWLPAGPATIPGDTVYRTALRTQRLAAELALDARDLPSARRWLEARDRWLAWSGAVLGSASNALGWAAYHRAGNDLGEARRQAEIALRQASAPRQPLVLIAAHRMAGELDTAEARYDAAADHLDAALTLAEACAAPYEQALTLLALVELDLAQGDTTNIAVSRLTSARSILESLNANPALDRVDALAARFEPDEAGGGAAEPETATQVAPLAQDRALLATLSARELDVLRLLPAGHTNQEIADLLFVSPKTVENHIGHILAKAALPNRVAAAAFAQRVGLV